MKLVRVVTIFVQREDFQVSVCCGLIDGLAVPAIHGTYFIDRLIREILPKALRIVPYHLRPTYILETSSYEESSSIDIEAYSVNRAKEESKRHQEAKDDSKN